MARGSARRAVVEPSPPAQAARAPRRGVRALVPALVLAVGGCGRLDELAYEPATSPEDWLAQQPHAQVAGVLVVQPTTSALVFGLAAVAMVAGALFWRDGMRASRWWGAGLVLWGAGAVCAGVSYEAFSYQLKCEGWDLCRWSSGWEAAYLWLSMASLAALAVAVASAGRPYRPWLSSAAGLCLAGYTAVLAAGVWLPSRLMASFELFLAFAAALVVACFAVNARRWRATRQRADRALAGAWVGLAAVIAAYVGYLASGVGDALWARGIWFTANDVLHVGLIAWLAHLLRVVRPALAAGPGAGPPGGSVLPPAG